MPRVGSRLMVVLKTSVLVAVLLSACTRPAPAPTTGREALPPTDNDKVTFDVHVGALEIPPNTERKVDSLGEITLTIVFSAPMDPHSTEAAVGKSLPIGSHFDWQDERSLLVTVPPGGPIVVDAAGAITKDGTKHVPSAGRTILRPRGQRISIYSVPDLIQGIETPLKQWTVDAEIEALNISPDSEWAVVYKKDRFMPGEVPFLVHLPTGKKKALSGPEHGTYAHAGWLPDGRLLLVGGQVWLGNSDGEQLKSVASINAWNAVVSPNAEYIALWGPKLGDGIALLTTNTGTMVHISGPFRRNVSDAGIQLEWSPDGNLLAGTDVTGNPSIHPQIRFVATSGDTVRVIQGFQLVKWLPGGELFVRPEAAPKTTVLLDEFGNTLRTFAINSPRISPNGQFLLEEPPDPWTPWTVVSTSSGAKDQVRLPGVLAGWTRDEALIVLERP